uniref:Ovule protein n=1 Tax=Mesocestoides corti TaxID=53468 RepID=A0A5K3FYW7_MESCO
MFDHTCFPHSHRLFPKTSISNIKTHLPQLALASTLKITIPTVATEVSLRIKFNNFVVAMTLQRTLIAHACALSCYLIARFTDIQRLSFQITLQ